MPDDLQITQHTQSAFLQVLAQAQQGRCSDLHLRADQAVFGRAQGNLIALECPTFSAPEIEEIIAMTSKRTLPSTSAFEYSFDQAGTARYRGHAFRQQGSWSLALRTIPLKVPTFQELRLPPVVKTFARTGPGLVLVTGPTGSGKSTTAAAMLDFVAQEERCHILSIEDPVEYRVQAAHSCVTQREVGLDVPTFVDGIYQAMREDPDVIFVGEVRDRDSLDAVLSAADTGHMVLATFHTHSALHTIRRLLSYYGQEDQSAVRERLADTLRGIVSQRLMPRGGGSVGRVLATEVLVNNFSTKDAIREPNKLKGVTAILEKSTGENMHSFDQSLISLVQGRLIEPATALAYAVSPNNMRRSFHIT